MFQDDVSRWWHEQGAAAAHGVCPIVYCIVYGHTSTGHIRQHNTQLHTHVMFQCVLIVCDLCCVWLWQLRSLSVRVLFVCCCMFHVTCHVFELVTVSVTPSSCLFKSMACPTDLVWTQTSTYVEIGPVIKENNAHWHFITGGMEHSPLERGVWHTVSGGTTFWIFRGTRWYLLDTQGYNPWVLKGTSHRVLSRFPCALCSSFVSVCDLSITVSVLSLFHVRPCCVRASRNQSH